jgi:hypothetical protein
VRSERRRQERERKAVEMNALESKSETGLEQAAAVLDEAIQELEPADRGALLLRFFEQRDFRSVGQALGSSEDAARMRVNRAVEKLHTVLRRRGVALPLAALGAALGAEMVTAAPAGLAASISGLALAGAASAGGGLTLLKFMTMTKAKFALLAAVALAGVAAPLVTQQQSIARLGTENQNLRQQQAQMADLAAENQRLSNQLAQPLSRQSLAEDQMRELLRLRGEVGMLRQQSNTQARLNSQLLERMAALQRTGKPVIRPDLSTEEGVRNECVNHLRMIDGAIQQCALENHLTPSSVVTPEQLQPYLPQGAETFRCPSGGTYKFGVVSNTPLCSIPGHALPDNVDTGGQAAR